MVQLDKYPLYKADAGSFGMRRSRHPDRECQLDSRLRMEMVLHKLGLQGSRSQVVE